MLKHEILIYIDVIALISPCHRGQVDGRFYARFGYILYFLRVYLKLWTVMKYKLNMLFLSTPRVPRRTLPNGTSKHPKGTSRNPIKGYYTKHPVIGFFELPLRVPNMKQSELPFRVPRGTLSSKSILVAMFIIMRMTIKKCTIINAYVYFYHIIDSDM